MYIINQLQNSNMISYEFILYNIKSIHIFLYMYSIIPYHTHKLIREHIILFEVGSSISQT